MRYATGQLSLRTQGPDGSVLIAICLISVGVAA